jgi:hypothetical protein
MKNGQIKLKVSWGGMSFFKVIKDDVFCDFLGIFTITRISQKKNILNENLITSN